MTYMIDAQLEQGVPSLRLINAATGEERLHWRGSRADGNSERNWQDLFKRLVLLSCADRLSLMQRAELPAFGDECLECAQCVDEEKDALAKIQIKR